MRFLLFLVLVFLLGLTGTDGLRAQPNTFYFLKGVPQTKDLNPARPGIEKGYYIAMPIFSKFDFSINANNWGLSDIIHQGSGAQSDSLVWDFKKFLSAIDKNNFVMESTALTLLDVGFKRGVNFYSISWAEREFVEPFFTKSLIDLMYYGNAPYIGTTYHTGYFGIGATRYREFNFNYARELNKKLSIGFTGKLLFGVAGVKTAGLNAIAGIPAGGDQIDTGVNGQLFSSYPEQFRVENSLGYQILTQKYSSGSNYFSNFGNPGFAIDLGFANKVSKQFEFSMSLIDLGFIAWKQDLTTYSENGHYLFQGLNLVVPANTSPDIENLVKALNDSVRTIFYPEKTATSFTLLLPVKLYIAAEYKINNNVSFGALARIRMFNNLIHTSYTASFNAAVSRKFSLSGSYSVMESTFDNLGLAASYRFGPVQLYAASDNIVSFMQPTEAENLNLRVGINLIFQDVARPRKGLYRKKEPRTAPGCPF